MKNKFIYQLIKKDIFGEITNDEKELLNKELKNNPDLLKDYQNEQTITEILSISSEQTFNIDIKDSVLAKINKKKYSLATFSQKGIIKEMLNRISMLPSKVKYGLSFGLGIVLTHIVLLFLFPNFFTGNNIPENELYGFMGDHKQLENATANTNLQFNSENVSALVSSKYIDDYVFLVIELSSSEPVQCILTFNEDNLITKSLIPLLCESQNVLKYEKSNVTIISSGKGKYQVAFKRKNKIQESINLKMLENQKLIYENPIQLFSK